MGHLRRPRSFECVICDKPARVMKNGFGYCWEDRGDLSGLAQYLGSSSLFGLDEETIRRLREDLAPGNVWRP